MTSICSTAETLVTLCDRAVDWSATGSMFGGIAAIIVAGLGGYSAAIAAKTYRTATAQKAQELGQAREAKAKEVWSGYLRLAFDNANITERNWDEITSKADETQDFVPVEKYEWLVATMFFAAEEILAISDDEQWCAVIKHQIGYYKDYVYGEDGEKYNFTYSNKVQELIRQVKEEMAVDPNRYSDLSYRQRKLLAGRLSEATSQLQAQADPTLGR